MNTLQLSTTAFRENEATEGFREVFGRAMLEIEIEPLGGRPFACDLQLRRMPGVAKATGTATPVYCRHLASQADNDDLVLVFMNRGYADLDQHGQQTAVTAGTVVLTANGEPASFHHPMSIDVVNLRLNRERVAHSVADLDKAFRAPILPEGAALSLLRSYLSVIDETASDASPALQLAIANHIYDLTALALGATRDAKDLAQGRGVRAARLHAIKLDIFQRLTRSDLTVDQIAGLQRISPGYVRQLFAAEETTFTEFVLTQRLALAHRMLSQPRSLGHAISRIAYDCGFSDLSYFNRSFRRRYGMTPSDVRAKTTARLIPPTPSDG